MNTTISDGINMHNQFWLGPIWWPPSSSRSKESIAQGISSSWKDSSTQQLGPVHSAKVEILFTRPWVLQDHVVQVPHKRRLPSGIELHVRPRKWWFAVQFQWFLEHPPEWIARWQTLTRRGKEALPDPDSCKHYIKLIVERSSLNLPESEIKGHLF